MTTLVLIVDMQQDFLDEPGLEPHRNAVVAGAARLLAAARSHGARVVHIQTSIEREPDCRMHHWKVAGRWSCVVGTPGHRAPVGLEPLPGETVLHKTGFGVGREALQAVGAGCDLAIVAGVHTHACVRQAVLELSEAGIAGCIARDACGTSDPWQAANAEIYLRNRHVAFLTAVEVLERLQGTRPPSVDVQPRVAATRRPRGNYKASASALPAAADLLEAEAEALARGITAEIGKPIRYARAEVGRTAALLRTVARRVAAEALETVETEALVRRRPLGCVAVITPWNNPLAIAAGQIAPALAFRNEVIWKPSPASPGTSEHFHRLMLAAGIDPEALEHRAGDGDAGHALVADPGTDAVCFTGSTATGRVIAALCSARFVPLQAELGGNNAVIVTAGTDLAHAAREVGKAAFGCAGQRCTATRRVIVLDAAYDEFLSLLAAATAGLAFGDPSDEATEVGPMLGAAQADAIRDCVERARQDGHRLLQPHASQRLAGAFHPPTIIMCADPDAEIVQTETFGPVLVVQRAQGLDEAIALANNVRHGLVAAMFGSDPQDRAQFLAMTQAGMLKIDQATVEAGLDVPFGGWKASGIGAPQHGAGNREFFTRGQTVYGNAGD